MLLRSALVLAALLALPVGAASAQELSREQPISVAGTTISLAEIRHWARVSAAASGSGTRTSRLDLQLAAQLLIGWRWVEGEARAQGVRVTPRQVSRGLLRAIHGTFPSWRALHAFLRESRQTFADLRRHQRVSLLSDQLRERAIGDVTDPYEAEARLDAWVTDFRARWRAQTLCTPRFAVARRLEPPSDCGNAPAE